jgi:hypothetical protein
VLVLLEAVLVLFLLLVHLFLQLADTRMELMTLVISDGEIFERAEQVFGRYCWQFLY